MKIYNRRDFNAGLLFIALGVFFGGYATDYGMGTGQRMGPGYFPFILAAIMTLLGAIVLVMAFLPAEKQDPPEATDWRGLGLVLGSVLLFALAIPYAGFLISVIGLVFVAAMASSESKRLETVFLAVALMVLSVGVFSYGLELQFPVLPPVFTQ